MVYCFVVIYRLDIYGVSLVVQDGDVVPKSGSGLTCNSGLLVSLPVGVREALETMSAMAVLYETGFDMSPGYMTHCRSQGVD